MIRTLLIVLAALLLAAGFVAWGGVRFDSDFVALYAAVDGAHHGISPWNESAQAALLTTELGLTEPFQLDAFGYPPWYVLLALPIGWLPYAEAGRAFLLCNLMFLFVGCYSATTTRPSRERLIAGMAVGFYLPLLGLLVVGQYTMPVFAGVGVGLLAVKRRSPWLLAAAALLLSFKWHVGALPGLALVVLVVRDRELMRRSVVPTLAVFAVACLAGFFLDGRWPQHYVEAVGRLASADVIRYCDTCSSLAWTASTRILDGEHTWIVSAMMLVIGAALMVARKLYRDNEVWLAASTALALMALPYVRNYDVALLALPIVLCMHRVVGTWARVLVASCWLIPLALPFLDRGVADELLGGTAAVIFTVLLLQGPESR